MCWSVGPEADETPSGFPTSWVTRRNSTARQAALALTMLAEGKHRGAPGKEWAIPSWLTAARSAAQNEGGTGRGHSGRRVATGPEQLLARMSEREGQPDPTVLVSLSTKAGQELAGLALRKWPPEGSRERAGGMGRGHGGGARRGPRSVPQVDCPRVGQAVAMASEGGRGRRPSTAFSFNREARSSPDSETLRGGVV